MKISYNFSNSTAFGSKNYPIKPFTIKTNQGELVVQELSKNDMYKASNFTLDNESAVDSWENSREYVKKYRDYYLNSAKENLEYCISKPDGNSTVLIAKDNNGQIKALGDMQYFDEIDCYNKLNKIKDATMGFNDTKMGYIEDLYVDSAYRNQCIGEKIINKLIETTKGHFTDIYLEAENKAINFYKKVGFLPLDVSNPTIKKVSDYILEFRKEGGYITLMSKSLDITDSCWSRLAKMIK